MPERRRVEILSPEDVDEVVSVLGESFFDYPVMRFVLGSEADYGSRLETLVGFFVLARALRKELLLGIRGPDELVAAALVSYPGRSPSPPELGELRERTWAALGSAARERYETFGEVASRFQVDAKHIHLNMIGVRPSRQGRGHARALLEAVHERSASDPGSSGVTLSTEVESNVPLYRRFGYEVVGSGSVESAFTTWVMYRPDP